MAGLSKAKELRAERARLAGLMNAIVERPAGPSGTMSAEQRVEFDRMDADLKVMLADAERIEKHEELMASLSASAGTIAGAQAAEDIDTDDPALDSEDDEASELARKHTGLTTRSLARTIAKGAKRNPKLHSAFDSYLRRGMGRITDEQRNLLESRMQPLDQRAQSAAIDTAGGYLVPEGFFNSLIEARLFFGGMRQSRATILPTSQGNDIPVPTDNDTSNTGERIGENVTVSNQDVSIGQVMLNAYTYSSKMIKVSRVLLQDSAFPLQPYLSRKMAQRIGRKQNTDFTVGTGAAQPQGVVAGATSGVSGASGQTTSFIYNDFVDLEHSVDRDYRENAEWMLSDTALKVVKKMKDGQGRPMWVPGLALREPDSILGYNYIVNNDVAVPAASAKSLLFGDFSQYFIRDVQEVLVLRLDERFADSLQVAFLAFARGDGKLVDAGTHPIKYFQHAAS
jgi:HK97 family phage major capsid protein